MVAGVAGAVELASCVSSVIGTSMAIVLTL
jgi:hypothetical protein